ncbi:heavy-metal-associated domain-containing protein [Salinisphaera orenii]|uniref:heavy-metal-associated domain-containing protein n=1 Tax=Salinisphaera orenii TaxID=856731 RepID=UPI000DBE7268
MIQIKIDGMSCQGCVGAVTDALADVDGVERVVDVSLEAGTADVEGNPAPEALIAAVEDAGFDARAV